MLHYLPRTVQSNVGCYNMLYYVASPTTCRLPRLVQARQIAGSSTPMKYQRTTLVHPNRLVLWQGGSDSREGAWTERENQELVAGGFESSDDEDDL